MGSGEDFCLKWNDHHTIFFSEAETLCRSSLLTDVTLATGDQTFPAHKLVLSVCSSFFRELFSKPEMVSSQSSVVYLKDVSSKQLEMLLSYMYRGEINVEEYDLINLLQTAKGLGVKGLSEVDDQNAVNLGNNKASPLLQSQPTYKTAARKKQSQRSEDAKSYDDILEVAPPKEMVDYDDNIAESSVEVVEPTIENMNTGNMEEGEGDWYDEDDGLYPEEQEEGYVQGTMTAAKKSGDFQEPPLNCPQCPKTFASSWHLKRHVQTHSKEKRFKCDLCGKFFSRNDNLKSHQKTVHGLLVPPGADDYFTKLSNPLRGMENQCQGGRVLASQEPGVKRKREESDVEDRENALRSGSEEPLFKIVKLVDETAVSFSDSSDKENEDRDESYDVKSPDQKYDNNKTENSLEEKEKEQYQLNAVEENAKNDGDQENKTAEGGVEDKEVKDSEEEEEEEEDYEVEEIVDYKVDKKSKKGFYLVKWVGWESESNTWEPLDHVEHCTEHLHSFYKARLDARSGATPSQKRSLELPPRPADYEEMERREEEEAEPEEEYEVEEILDYQYCRDRQAGLYLVKWVGWEAESNTWEPESNLGCTDLLTNFYKARLKDRETQTPAEKRAKPLPPDPRETFQKRQDFLKENVPSFTRKQLERYFQADREKPVSKRAKMVPEKVINEAVDQCIKSSRPNNQKLNLIREQMAVRQMMLARSKQLADIKQYEKEINEVDANAHVYVINDVDLEGPPRQMKYINAYRAGEGISIPDDPLLGCSCQSCDLKNKSCCPQTSGDFHFPYTKHGKLREVIGLGSPIYECNKRCECDENCTNRVVQKGRKHKLAIFRTDNGCGWGVKAMENIKKDSFVVEYVGEVITSDEAEERGRKYDAEGRTYLFDLDFNLGEENLYTVDAAFYGNLSHFINHSCDPNLSIFSVYVNNLDPNMPQLAMFARKDIKRGEQITFDYCQSTAQESAISAVLASPSKAVSKPMEENEKVGEETQASVKTECRCGAKRCRKVLF